MSTLDLLRKIGLTERIERVEKLLGISAGVSEEVRRMQEIRAVVALHYGVSVTRLLAPERSRHVVWPRFVAMHLIRKKIDGVTTRAIGEVFNRGHAMAVYGLRSVRDRLSVDPNFAAEVTAIESKVAEI